MLLVLIIGIWSAIRRVPIRRCLPEHFPGVPTADFQRWKRLASNAYAWAIWACLAKILFDTALRWYSSSKGMDAGLFDTLAWSSFGVWLLALVLGLVQGVAARTLRTRLGIDPARVVPRPPSSH